MAERIVEHLKFETELLKLTALAALAVGGGTLGLIVGELTVLRFWFAMGGLVVTVAMVVSLWRQRRAIRGSIAGIRETRP